MNQINVLHEVQEALTGILEAIGRIQDVLLNYEGSLGEQDYCTQAEPEEAPQADPVPVKKTRKKPAAKPAPEPEPEPELVSFEQVRAVMVGLSKDGHSAQIRELIGSFGASKLSQIQPSQYADLLVAAKEIA